MPTDQPTPDVDTRIESVLDGFDLGAVAEALSRQSTEILDAWLAIASRQPFHADRPDAAISDHVPTLVDQLIRLLRETGPGKRAPGAPMDDPGVIAAAEAHAQLRFEQHLGPVAIATEFRLLRHEVARALARTLEDDVSTAEV